MGRPGNGSGGNGLHRLNTMSPEQAGALLETCLAVPRWVDAVVARRPYPDVAAVLDQGDTAAGSLTADEVNVALARHPRIGERPAPGGQEATFSRREQSGVDTGDAEVAKRLLALNTDYEARFDRVFLIRAKGRSAQEILVELERRLGNDEKTEASEVADQLREIALLRLREVLGG